MMTPEQIEQAKEKAYRLGFDYEAEYRGCGQCVVGAIQDALSIRDDAVFQAASGFAGGIGLAGDSACGAYAGAVMMLSSHKGRQRDTFDDPERLRFKSFAMAKMMHDRMVNELGGVNCHAIQNKIFGRPFYLWDQEQMDKFDQMGGHADKCPHVVGLAARLAVELLAEEGLI